MNKKHILLTLGLLIIISQSIFADPNEDLLKAAKSGDLTGVQTALENKANVNAQNVNGYSALLFAVEKNFIEIVDFLLQNDSVNPDIKTQLGTTPLLTAAGNNNLTCTVLLLAAGANPTLGKTIHYTKKGELTEKMPITPLTEALSSGKIPGLTNEEKTDNLAITRILQWAESLFNEENLSESSSGTLKKLSSPEGSSQEEDNSEGATD